MTAQYLLDMFQTVHGARVPAEANPLIEGVAFDSRQVKPGYLFIALQGDHVDGRQFIPSAIQNGAVAVMTALPADTHLPQVIVPDAELAMAQVACQFYQYPSRKMRVIGITGTNGKTTTAILAAHIMRYAGRKTAVIGTLGASSDGVNWKSTGHTTPQSPDLQRILAELRDEGVADVVMEISSHAISQKRTHGLELDVAAMLNLTQDHLDYYGDMASYAAAKKQLFTEYPDFTQKKFTSVMNMADSTARGWSACLETSQLNFGPEGSGADAAVSGVQLAVDSVSYTLTYHGHSYQVTVPLGGGFQVWNSAAAWCCCVSIGIEPQIAADALRCCPSSPGRFEMVPNDRGVTVLVDYAHTPDGLVNVLNSARNLNPRELVVVFGCGGDRDATKRPVMGKIAVESADRVYVTSDNPRTEDAESIIQQIIAGMPQPQSHQVSIEADRKLAIHMALASLQPGDILVIAGKGHEDYQIIGTTKYPFDDRIIATEWFQGDRR